MVAAETTNMVFLPKHSFPIDAKEFNFEIFIHSISKCMLYIPKVTTVI